MAADDRGKAGGLGMEIERFHVVDDVDHNSGQLGDLSLMERLCPRLGINVATDRGHRSDFFQSGNDLRGADVTRVDDVLGALERDKSFRTKQPMSIRDDADNHRLQACFNARARIHVVTKRVADEVEREYRQHDSCCGEEHKMGCVE